MSNKPPSSRKLSTRRPFPCVLPMMNGGSWNWQQRGIHSLLINKVADLHKEDMPEMPKKRTRGETADKDHKELTKLLGAPGKSRISQNINQLAKAANSGSLPVNLEVVRALKDASEAIKWMRDTLVIDMGLKPQSENPDKDQNDP